MNSSEDKSTGTSGGNGLVFLSFISGFAAFLLIGWAAFPKLLYSRKHQPFDFNHQLHNELVDDGCQSCHYFREDGSYAGVPKLARCVDCHGEMQGETEDERIFVEEYVKTGTEVPWLVYSRQPDCVFFSHAAHVKGAGMDCAICHGPIGHSTSLKPFEQNRISGYSRDIWGQNIAGFKSHTWDRMKMDDCSACHQKEGVAQNSVQTSKGACFVCHK
ncbi:MAG: cytochrome C [Desulfobacterales bacterium]|nr:MAG: cytochrome C [Desulfobacterales bacterium]